MTVPVSRGRRRAFALSLVLATMALLPGCGFLFQDTCAGGQNMTDPYLVSPFDARATAPELVIGWSQGTGPGAHLPEAYFEAVQFALGVHEPDVAALLSDVRYEAPRRIVVTLASLQDYVAANDGLSFELEFPDRREFISCRHPAAPDRYFLTIDLAFDATGAFESVTLDQRVLLGPF
ncbi:MAG: hypothetical protein R6W77_16795 [Trueperaceae bacterium]